MIQAKNFYNCKRRRLLSKKETRNKSVKVKKSIYDDRLAQLILAGELKTKGIDGLFRVIRKEFNSGVNGLTLKSFQRHALSIIWNKEVSEALRQIVGNDLPLKKFLKLYPYIPEKMVNSRAKSLTGLSATVHPVTFMRGLGRIGDLAGMDDDYKLPKGTYSNPFVVQMGGGDRYIRIINGVNLGLSHKRLIEDNPVRRALADANLRGVKAVFIVNPVDIEVRKASGGLRILRAMASGLNLNVALLEESYRKELRNRDPHDPRPSYETVAERFMNALSGYWKITHKPDGKEKESPEYTGMVYIVLGYKEEEIIASAADWELSYWMRVEQNQIQAEIRVLTTRRTQAQRFHDYQKVEKLNREIEQLSERKARVIASNISDGDKNRYRRKVLNFVVKELEKNIPNSKVIGLGSTVVKIGEELVEIHVPRHLRITDTLLAEYTSGYPGRAVMKTVPETAVICHPHSLGYRMTDREIGVNDRRAEARMFVAPIANDGTFLREVLADSVRPSHQISRAVFNTQFNSGVLDLRFYEGGNISADAVPLSSLAYHSNPRTPKQPSGVKYIWIMVGTDPHYGSRMREEVWSEKAQKSLGMSDAAIQMFREAGLCQNGKLPIHMYTINDDPTQGNHFETHKQPHSLQMSYQQIEKQLQTMSHQAGVQMALKQLRVRGSDWLQEQVIQVLDRHIQPNIDFFSEILLRVNKSGLRIRGISDIHKESVDTRDVGAINLGTGNHFESTVDRVMTEGFIYVYYLRALLYSRPEWKNKTELVDKLVRFPLEGNQYFAWGTVKGPEKDNYEWALEFRADPPRMGSWADPLLGAVRNDNSRGDYGLFMTGRKTVKIYGDKHFLTAAKTDHIFYLMGAPGTSTDLYGHRGFPPNNSGVSFLGIPVDGPDSGPILVRSLHVEHIRRYFERPYKFDWESFLPNPV
jgi:hypothetical protein